MKLSANTGFEVRATRALDNEGVSSTPVEGALGETDSSRRIGHCSLMAIDNPSGG